MRRIFDVRIAAVALLVVALGIVAGVAWAASPRSGPAAHSAEPGGLGASIKLDTGNGHDTYVPAGTPALKVFGSGFGYPDAVYVEINVGADKPTIPVGGTLTTSAGTFRVSATRLSVALAPGIYSIVATSSDGSVATAPLVVCAKDKDGRDSYKC